MASAALHLAVHLRNLRHTRGLSLRDLAIRVGITPQSIGQIETSQRRPDLDTVERIADALGADLRVSLVERGAGPQTDEDELLQAYRSADPALRAVVVAMLRRMGGS